MPKKSAKSGVSIKLVKSLIGCKQKQVSTAYSLALRKIGDITVQPDNEQTAGKINRISHLIEVTKA